MHTRTHFWGSVFRIITETKNDEDALTKSSCMHVDINKLHVIMIIIHVNINKSHVNKIILHVKMTVLAVAC